MKKILKATALVLGALLIGLLLTQVAMGATNQATDPGGGGVTLTASGNVTINSLAMQLIKQVYDNAGNCLASSPSDATCNGGATTITVAAGTPLRFLIFVKNASDVVLNDVRFQDVLDVTATGFTYTAASMKHDMTQLDTATAAQIYAAANAGTADTDAVDATAGNYASITGAPLSNMTIGAVVGQVNAVLNVTAHRTFGLLFQATKK